MINKVRKRYCKIFSWIAKTTKIKVSMYNLFTVILLNVLLQSPYLKYKKTES